jgi:hypothetical protein
MLDLNQRSPGYEPGENIQASPMRDIKIGTCCHKSKFNWHCFVQFICMSLFTINITNHVDVKGLLKELKLINLKLTNMPTKAEFQQALDEVTSSLENIAADITRLTDQLENGSLSEAEEAEVFTQLRAVADRAKNIADTTPESETPQP